MRRASLLLILSSGAAGLIAEVVWSRALATLFGSVLTATGLLLALFMAGLSLGSLLGGVMADRSRRPLLAYGIAEVLIGALVLVTPSYFRAIAPLVIRIDTRLPDSLAPIVPAAFSLLLLGPIVMLMGATFPFFLRHYSTKEDVGDASGIVYGINTIGAVVGTVIAGFWLLPAIGIHRSLLIAAAIDVTIGAIAVVAGWRHVRAVAESIDAGARQKSSAYLSIVALLGGIAALTLEVTWFRVLMLIFGSSVYAISTMLAAFLLGIGAGAIVIARRSADRAQRETLMRYQALIAFSAILVTVILQLLPLLYIALLRRSGADFATVAGGTFAILIVVLLVPTTLMGAALPLAIAIATHGAAHGHETKVAGRIYAFSSLGSSLGALGAGFVLIPLMGVRGAVGVAAVCSLAAAFVAFGKSRELLQIGGLTAAVWIAWMAGALPWDWRVLTGGYYAYAHLYTGNQASPTGPMRRDVALADSYPFPAAGQSTPYPRPSEERGKGRLLMWRDGMFAQVAVVEEGTLRFLLLNGKADASNGADDMRTQLMLAHLPALLAPKPPSGTAMVIGLGSGVTAGAVDTWPFQKIIAAEIEPAVVQATEYFRPENRDVLRDRRVVLRVDDARRTLARSKEPIALLTSEPTNLWMSGVTLLFTREFFELAADRLGRDGVFCQWIHLYQVGEGDVKTLVATMRQSFPHIVAFVDGSDLLFVASRSPLVLDPAVWQSRLAANAEGARALRRAGVSSSLDIASGIIADERGLARWSDGAELHTDDHPILEFTAARQMGFDNSKAILSSLVRTASSVGPIPLDGRGAIK